MMIKEKNASKTKIKSEKNDSFMRFFLSVIIIVGLGYVIFNYVPFIAKYNYYSIVTDSMEPVIMVGDVAIIDSSVEVEELVSGQIIAFYADFNDDGTKEVIVHYLDSASEVDGVMVYRTHPEVSDSLDPWTLAADDIIGVHVGTIANIGPLLLFFSSTVGKITLVLDIAIIYILIELLSSKKKKEKNLITENLEDNK